MTASDAANPRKRFMSLKTSLPDKEKFVYTSVREMIQGRTNEDKKGPVINIKNIDTIFDNFLNKSIKKTKFKN